MSGDGFFSIRRTRSKANPGLSPGSTDRHRFGAAVNRARLAAKARVPRCAPPAHWRCAPSNTYVALRGSVDPGLAASETHPR